MGFLQLSSCRRLFSGDSMFWQEEIRMLLSRMLSSDDKEQLAKVAKILESETTFRELTNADIRNYVEKLKSLSDAEIDRALELIRGEFGSCDESPHYNRYLNWGTGSGNADRGYHFCFTCPKPQDTLRTVRRRMSHRTRHLPDYPGRAARTSCPGDCVS